MKNSIVILIISVFAFQTTQAQKLKGNKIISVENREIADFSSILIKDNLEVFFTKSLENTVSVETDENLQFAVRTEVINGVLEIFLSDEIKRKKELNIHIAINESIEQIEAQDHVKIKSESELHIDNLKLIAKDQASIELILKTKSIALIVDDKSDIKLALTNSGDIDVILEQSASLEMQSTSYKTTAILHDKSSFKSNGNCKELVLTVDTNANFKGKNFLTDYADVNLSDDANVNINVSNEIIIKSEDDAKLYLFGNPRITMEKFSDTSTLYKK